MSRADFRRFIGVSLGGGRGKTTAVARLELSSGTLTLAEARAHNPSYRAAIAARDGAQTG